MLLFGGGDGLAAREVLKCPGGRAHHPGRARPGHGATVLRATRMLAGLNGGSFASPKLDVINAGRVRLAEAAGGPGRPAAIRRRDRRLPGPVATSRSASSIRLTFFTHAAPGAGARRRHRRAEHVALRRAPLLLVRGRDAGGGRVRHLPVPRLCARPSASGASCSPASSAPEPRDRYPAGLRFVSAATFADHAAVSRRHGPRAGRREPAR